MPNTTPAGEAMHQQHEPTPSLHRWRFLLAFLAFIAVRTLLKIAPADHTSHLPAASRPPVDPSPVADSSLPALVKRIQPAVVTIVTYDAAGHLVRQGTGFFISRFPTDPLITNRHVLQGAARATVKTYDGHKYRVTMVTAEDQDADLVQVVTDMPMSLVQTLQLSVITPDVGERVIVVGSPLGMEQTVSEGIVSALRKGVIQITAPLSHGSSGSPVVNMNGKVVGVATLGV